MAASWSGIRKELEQDLLCESLRGRVQYFMTHYHGAPDNYGRFCVRVDGREYAPANPYNECWHDAYSKELRAEKQVPYRRWDGHHFLYDKENQALEQEADRLAENDGLLNLYHITCALELYRSQDVQTSLSSESPVVRMFAVLDRRVGKRTLRRLAGKVAKQPKWLQFFYTLRLEAEGISIEP